MKIVVFRTGALFGHDETRPYVETLSAQLVQQGHTVETITLPFSPSIADIVPETLAYRLFDLNQGFDMCINVGPFSHALKHPNKRVWLFSLYSAFYEHWDTPFGAVTASHSNMTTRGIVHDMDRKWLGETPLVRTASKSLQTQLQTQGVSHAAVLPPALLPALQCRPSQHDDYFLVVAAIVDTARLPLIIKSFGQSRGTTKLVIAGYEVTREEREYIQHVIATSPRASEITLELGASSQRVRDLIASALALVALPIRAGALDPFAVAAACAQRALVTANDCGEVAHLVQESTGGYCVEPDVKALAEALEDLSGRKKTAVRFGKNLFEKLQPTLPSWDAIASELTQ